MIYYVFQDSLYNLSFNIFNHLVILVILLLGK